MEGFTSAHQVQATPPENDWLIDTEGTCFYQLTDGALTNIPSISPHFQIFRQIVMESDISEWNFNANAISASQRQLSNGELFVVITNGGSLCTCFVRQIGLPREWKTYTLTFDIRSDTSRTFSMFIQNQADFTLKYLEVLAFNWNSISLSYTFTTNNLLIPMLESILIWGDDGKTAITLFFLSCNRWSAGDMRVTLAKE